MTDYKVTQIACGGSHTIALTEDPSEVYSWGCNKYGQAGINSLERVVPHPTKVDI